MPQLADASVQTTAEDEPIWQQTVEAILEHKTEGTRMGVRFLVKWLGFNVQTMERYPLILEKGGRQILINYLLNLQKHKRRCFQAILNNQPAIGNILVEPEETDSQATIIYTQ